MHHFAYRRGVLHAEGVSLEALARRHGTPLYVYSAQTLLDHYRRLDAALAPLDHWICYAVKANSNVRVLELLARAGAGFDIVSGGELRRVLRAGGDAGRCTFAGVGKTDGEIRHALREGIYCFNVESEEELGRIARLAAAMKRVAPVAFRVNPDVDAGTHAKITTGTYDNKFGIPFEEIPALYARASRKKSLRLRGVQMHIGSQITSSGPFHDAVRKMAPLALELKQRYGIEFFDVGGGLGVVYHDALASGTMDWWEAHPEPPLTPADYARAVLPWLEGMGLKILVEPGRFIAANAGVLVATVLGVKQTARKRFVIVDAAMNDLIRPAFYDSYHEIVPLRKRAGEPVPGDVVGPVCESGDTFCKDRLLPPLRAGDRVAFMTAGAYGFVMAGNYNSRPLAAEILVRGRQARVARQRQTFEQMMAGENFTAKAAKHAKGVKWD